MPDMRHDESNGTIEVVLCMVCIANTLERVRTLMTSACRRTGMVHDGRASCWARSGIFVMISTLSSMIAVTSNKVYCKKNTSSIWSDAMLNLLRTDHVWQGKSPQMLGVCG